MKLTRTKQCQKCPWKVSTDPRSIPDDYCETKHRSLADTIAKPASLDFNTKAMACHHSNGTDQMYCIGWLHHQLGPGNNIGLRLRMRQYENVRDMRVYGPQHARFEDTLPK